MRAPRPYTYLATVKGMCRQCRQLVPCRVIAEHDAVYQERLCPRCGPSRALIAESLDWYSDVTRAAVRCRPPGPTGTPVKEGCPWDCGPCRFHANACHLPVFSITNVCNMRCPICFTYNRPEAPYFMSRRELKLLLDRVIERAGPLDLVNVTGGEPLLHPRILDMLEECARPEIGRVTVNSNGLRLADDTALCEGLARLGAYVILSLHTLDPATSRTIHGRDVVAVKLKALENLQKHEIGTTLLNVMIRDVNEHRIGTVIELARRYSVVRSITVQTMTFTGQGGGAFSPRRHLPLDAAARAIEDATNGRMRREHFFPHPGAHPLCYSIAYYLKDEGGCRSLTDLFSVQELRGMIAGGYLLQPNDAFAETFKLALDRLWAEGSDPPLLKRLREMIDRLYPADRRLSAFDRQRLAEESILTVYLHAHMDEDTLDLGRLISCPDQVPDSAGRMIPACAYNIFYRRQDRRFFRADSEETVCS